MQKEKRKFLTLKFNFAAGSLHVFQIEDVEFIYGSLYN